MGLGLGLPLVPLRQAETWSLDWRVCTPGQTPPWATEYKETAETKRIAYTHNWGTLWTPKIQKTKNPTAASEVLEQKLSTVHNPAYCTAKKWGWADHQAPLRPNPPIRPCPPPIHVISPTLRNQPILRGSKGTCFLLSPSFCSTMSPNRACLNSGLASYQLIRESMTQDGHPLSLLRALKPLSFSGPWVPPVCSKVTGPEMNVPCSPQESMFCL